MQICILYKTVQGALYKNKRVESAGGHNKETTPQCTFKVGCISPNWTKLLKLNIHNLAYGKSVKSVVFDVHKWRMCVQNEKKGKKTAVAQVTSAHWAQTTTHTVQVWRVPRTNARIYKHTGSIQRKCTMSCFQIETAVLLCSLTTSSFTGQLCMYLWVLQPLFFQTLLLVMSEKVKLWGKRSRRKKGKDESVIRPHHDRGCLHAVNIREEAPGP